MKKIKNQLDNSEVENIFKVCYDNFILPDVIKVLDMHKDKIINESKEYNKYVPKKIGLYNLFSGFKKEEKEAIQRLYTEKMAKANAVGSFYYNVIKSNSPVCPFCGGAAATELDHFIPKTLYPQLCITPYNLIPICHICNDNKRTKWSTNYLELPFNPYFDVMDEEWVECDIVFKKDVIVYYKFYIGVPNTNPLYQKYEAHFNAYRLDITLPGFCVTEISLAEIDHLNSYNIDKTKLLEDLISTRDSCEAYDINSWKAALYRALVKQFKQYCLYLSFK